MHSVRSFLPSPLLAAGLLILGPAAPHAPGQGFDLLVSTTSDADVAGAPARDQELLFHRAGQAARVAWASETLAQLAGDLDGDGLHDEPGDVDAVHDGGGSTAADGLYVSFISDDLGVLDGDVVQITPLGLVPFLAEADVITATGATDGNVDVDAFHLDPDGSVLFSFAEDEASSSLSGDATGVIADGDILLWAATGGVQVLLTESQVDGLVSVALGSATSTGDTKGLARDPDTGAVLFSVQSPSAHDASVFSDGGGGSLVAGHEESDFGYGGAAELDALTVAHAAWPGLTVADPRPQPGEDIVLTVRGAAPGSLQIVLAALDVGPVLVPLDGWGGLVLANDAMLDTALRLLPTYSLVADGMGEASISIPVPAGMVPLDLTFQAVTWSTPALGSNPLVVELVQ